MNRQTKLIRKMHPIVTSHSLQSEIVVNADVRLTSAAVMIRI